MNSFIKTSVVTLTFALAALACCFAAKPSNRAEKIAAEMHNPRSEYVVVVVHRGDWRNYPENSIPAIESIIRMGADIMELDLKMTKDSVLVLCHDKTLDRTTTGKGEVGERTLAEIKSYRLKRAHGVPTDSLRMPTLEEALAVCKDRIVVNIDQGYQYYDKVIEISERLGVTKQILIKGKMPLKTVEAEMAKYPNNMMYMPIIDIQKPQGRTLFGEYMDSGAVPIAYEVCWRQTSPEVIECFNKILNTGSKIWVNTIWRSLCGGLDDDAAFDATNPALIYDKVLEFGTSIIQTDRPELLIKYLDKKGRHKLK